LRQAHTARPCPLPNTLEVQAWMQVAGHGSRSGDGPQRAIFIASLQTTPCLFDCLDMPLPIIPLVTTPD